MRITMLGTAAGLPTPQRSLPAVAVEVDGETILFDCGEGTQRQMMVAGISLCRKMKIFITHLHGDHIFGLPGLLQTMNLMNRSHPLHIFGPPGIDDFIRKVGFTLADPVFDLLVSEVCEGEIHREGRYNVEGAWAEHSRPSMAYRLTVGASLGRFRPDRAKALGVPEGPLWSVLKRGEEVELEGGRTVHPAEVLGEPIRGRTLVYTGDTRPSESVVRLASGADLLIHEATFGSELAENAESEGHSTAGGAARVALKAGVGRLILTHISARYPDPTALEEEARAIFGNTEVAHDFMTIQLQGQG